MTEKRGRKQAMVKKPADVLRLIRAAERKLSKLEQREKDLWRALGRLEGLFEAYSGVKLRTPVTEERDGG